MNDARRRYLEFGEFRLDTVERALTRKEQPVPLTFRCYDLLLTFVNNAGHLLTHDELMNSVWEDASVDRSSLKQTIATLRKTLGDEHEQPRFIQTVPKFGYRFVAPVEQLPDEDIVLVAERSRMTVVDYEERSSDPDSERKSPSLVKNSVWVGSIALLIALGGFALWDLVSRSRSNPDFLSYSWRALSADDKEGVTAISPNGEFIIFFEHAEQADRLKMKRLAGEESITILPNIDIPVWGTTISHDNNYVYYILAERESSATVGTLYRISVLGGQPRKILEGITGGPTLSPDDSKVAFIRSGAGGESMLMTADTGDGGDEHIVSSSDTQAPLWNPAWSPDGKSIVCFTREKREDGTYYNLVEITPAGGELRRITEPSKKYIWWHSWMHDGSGLLAVKSDDVTNLRQLVFISYPGGEITKISNDLNQYSAMSASDDGTKIVTNRFERQSNIVITDENGNGAAPLQLYACCPDTVSWISEDEIVFDAFADGKRSLWTMLVNGTGQKKLFSTDAQDWAPDASPDAQSIVFLSTRSGSRQIWKSHWDGTKPQQITHVAVDVDSPRYSSDGSYIYFSMLADGKWLVARIGANGGAPETVVDQNTGVWDISPDGKSIAYSFWPDDSEHQNLAVADIDTGNIMYRFDVTSKYLLRWTPDGRQLISEDPDPENSALQILSRQDVTSNTSRTALDKSSLVNYFVAVSPVTHRYAFVRGHLISSPSMLMRKEL